ncbi:MAG: hypothetical protein QW275_03225 [Candidatus Anstonellaceae archaeon]
MNFGKSALPTLDECVIDALSLFACQPPPKLDLPHFSRPLVVGSGNAAVTGKILFEGSDAVFADESTYLAKLSSIHSIDGCVLISASGGKHAPIIAKEVSKRKLPIILLTNNPNAPASKFASHTIVFPKNPEPYTYNTSTYLGMVLAKTGENPLLIKKFLEGIRVPSNLGKYNAFFILVPLEMEPVREMFLAKFDELFGPKVVGRAFTLEQAKHAKTVVGSDSELFIGLGESARRLSRRCLDISLPPKASYATLIAAGYYIIGKIQGQHPPYFKDSIESYLERASKDFHEKIPLIVE